MLNRTVHALPFTKNEGYLIQYVINRQSESLMFRMCVLLKHWVELLSSGEKENKGLKALIRGLKSTQPPYPNKLTRRRKSDGRLVTGLRIS